MRTPAFRYLRCGRGTVPSRGGPTRVHWSPEKYAPGLSARSDGSHRFEPAREPASALCCAVPPTAARGQHDERRQARIGSFDLRHDIRCFCRGAGRLDDQCDLLLSAGGFGQPLLFFAADLQHGRPEGLGKIPRVDGAEPGPSCPGYDNQPFVLIGPAEFFDRLRFGRDGHEVCHEQPNLRGTTGMPRRPTTPRSLVNVPSNIGKPSTRRSPA